MANRTARFVPHCLFVLLPALVLAQEPAYAPPQQKAYPAQYPQIQYPQASTAVNQAPPQGRMRQFFAATLAAVMQGSGASTTLGLSDMVAGGISDWFDRKQRRKNAASAAPPANYQQPAYPQEAYPQETYPQSVPEYAPLPEYHPGADPNTFAPQTSFGESAQYAPVQYFDAQTGAPSSTAPEYLDSQSAYSPEVGTSAPMNDTLYAGMAYEVHTLAPGGLTQPVNPANHVFRTGDQFIVMYRPSLPGRMSVVNVNPAGRETEIDRIDVAAGQLLRLGPYRFESMQGDEALRFVITPCSSPALTMATRDIVRVNEPQTGTGLNLGGCNSLATRSIRAPPTRDIRKVAVEGTTGFAFDPVSPQELASGEFAPRELTVMFRHR